MVLIWNNIATASPIEITQAGYLMVFMSSVSSTVVSIDNLTVTLYNGSEIEEDHYYPFGLCLETPVTGAILPAQVNNIKYNRKELQHNEFTDASGNKSGLTWEDVCARMQDPQIGRWNGIDEKAEDYESFSPYVYGANNPVKYSDKDGKGIWDVVVGYVYAVIDNATGANFRANHQTSNERDARDYANGQHEGDVHSMLFAIAEGTAGTGLESGGVVATVASGGTLSEVGLPAAGIGLGMQAHSVLMFGKAVANLANDVSKGGGNKTPAQARADKLSEKPRPGKDMTNAGKEAVKDLNKEKNNGKTVCENCGIETTPSKQSKAGILRPQNETVIDHEVRKKDGGSGTPDNGQVYCSGCNEVKH